MAICIKDLKKTYKGGVRALQGVSLDVQEGEFYALLGPNGAGKTTTIGILTGLVLKTSGTVTVFGKDLDKEPLEVRKFLGVVPQEFNLGIFETVFEIVVNQAGYYGVPRKVAEKKAEQLLKRLDLWEKRNTNARYLSGGMKRRLMIARGLVHEPKILILDEPTAGVDVELRRDMWEFLVDLNKNGTTIILTTHYLEEAEELATHIGIIDQGKVLRHASKKKLLKTMHAEAYVVSVAKELKKAPKLAGYDVSLRDEQTLEIVVPPKKDVSGMVAALKKKNIVVESLRPKSNKLEALFLELVKK